MPRKDKSASEWTLKKFKNIKLKYNDTFDSLEDFSEKILDHLKEADSEKVRKTLHQKKKDIHSYMEKYWNFTIDIKKRRTNKIERALEKLNKATDKDEDLIRYLRF